MLTPDEVLEIARRIKELRVQKGMFQSDVAKKAGIAVNHYARLERGEVPDPKISTIRNIIKALGGDYNKILNF